MLSIKYSISPEDYVNYYTYVMWDSPEKKRSKLRYYLRQAAFNGLIIAVLLYADIFKYNRILLYAYLGILLITALLQIFSARAGIRKRAEKIAASANNQSIFVETQAEISDAGITMKDEFSETKLQWKAFVKKLENDEYYFLFTNSIQAIIFPKRIFRTNDERMAFEKCLSVHLSFDAEVGYLLKK